jgi:hypothetical protein
LDAQYKALGRPLVIVETGTMFKVELEPGETDLGARSTYAITKWIESNGGTAHRFYSIDIDRQHINVCRDTLGVRAAFVSHRQGIGSEILAGRGLDGINPDLVLLDADSDADSIYKEFAEIAPVVSACGGIIVIDDVFKHHSVNKGRKVLPTVKAWYDLEHIAAGIPFGKSAEQILSRKYRKG